MRATTAATRSIRASASALAILAILSACSSKYDLPQCDGAGLTQTGVDPLIWDDGQSTFLRMEGNLPIPAIYAVEPATPDKEVLVESTVIPDGEDKIIMIHRTAFEWRFRTGDVVICIINENWNPVGRNPGTGTTSPDVRRVVK